jgi:hypothetical protein
MSEFPPNSFTGTGDETPQDKDEKKVEQVTTETPKRRKKRLGKRFKSMFMGGDAKTAGNYVIFDVLIPAAKDTIVEAGSQLIERMIFGESRRRRGSSPPVAGPTGYVSYNRYAMNQGGPVPQDHNQPRISQRARAQHNFDEIELTSRQEAERVLEQLFQILSKYEVVSVADLYASVGFQSTHVDNKWGWTSLSGAGVSKVRGGGFLLDLPEPQPLA